MDAPGNAFILLRVVMVPFLTKMFRAVAGGNIAVTAALVIIGTVMVIVGRFVDPTLKPTNTKGVNRSYNGGAGVSARTGPLRYVAITLVVLGTVLVLVGLLPYAILSVRYLYAKR